MTSMTALVSNLDTSPDTRFVAGHAILDPWRIAAVLSSLTLLLAAANIAVFLSVGVEAARSKASFRLMDFGYEGNLTAFLSALILLAAALACLGNAAGDGRQPLLAFRAGWPGWRVLALIFVFLSIDEAVELHENFNRIELGLDDSLAFLNLYTWVAAYLPAAILMGLACVPFLRRLPRRTAALIGLSGMLFLTGAVGLELIGAWQRVVLGLGPNDLALVLRGLAEEVTEIIAVILFIGAALEYAAWRRISIRLDFRTGQHPYSPSP